MDDVVIRAEGLGKAYLIGHRREDQHSFRDALAQGARNTVRKLGDVLRGRAVVDGDALEQVWALRDAGFTVRRGEVLGIVGANGAGKSTLLKILARIVEPTEGRVAVRGRVASLLEVGTGFHWELSGRDNVFLNGAILGMSRREIRAKFDEIVAFAGVERYIDTPVKRYSSGMYMRLAFAVAAHLEPDILLVDEVLAVGDAAFQRKCLARIGEVAREGRTVLFVSHHMAAIAQRATRALLIDGGRVQGEGPPAQVIGEYLGAGARAGGGYARTLSSEAAGILGVEVETSRPRGVHAFGAPLTVRFRLQAARPTPGAALAVEFLDEEGRVVTRIGIEDGRLPICRSGQAEVLECRIPAPRLSPGRYSLAVEFFEHRGDDPVERIEGLCPFEVWMPEGPEWPAGGRERCAYVEDATWVRPGAAA